MKTILLDTSIDYTSWDINEAGIVEMTEWQPIETCPKYNWLKKNQFVLVRCKVRDDAYQVFQAAYDPMEKDKNRFWVPIPDNRRRKKSGLSGIKAIQQLLMYKPTHWMPLPPAPVDANNTSSERV